jgi:hypothetical protein
MLQIQDAMWHAQNRGVKRWQQRTDPQQILVLQLKIKRGRQLDEYVFWETSF